jgi:hypothetical protein
LRGSTGGPRAGRSVPWQCGGRLGTALDAITVPDALGLFRHAGDTRNRPRLPPRSGARIRISLPTPLASRQLLSVRPARARNRLSRQGLRRDLGSTGPQRGRHSLSERRSLSKPGDLADLVPRFQHKENQAVLDCSRWCWLECRLPGRSGPATALAPQLACQWRCRPTGRRAAAASGGSGNLVMSLRRCATVFAVIGLKRNHDRRRSRN